MVNLIHNFLNATLRPLKCILWICYWLFLICFIWLQVYGLELTELQQTSGKTIKKQYILLNNLSSEAQADFVDT